jgi:sulfoxide reductase heme-binding subunit YedZ
MSSKAVWYLMRGTGVTSLLLLTGVVVLGILTSRKTSLPTLPRFATMTLHRSVSLLAVLFLGIHVITAVADPYAQVRLLDTVVPFAGSWQALPLGLGTLALDLFAAVIVSSLLMRHIGRRIWRTIHWLGYGSWPLAFVHSLGIGSDSRTLWLRALALAMLATIAAALTWRLGAAPATPDRRTTSSVGGRAPG